MNKKPTFKPILVGIADFANGRRFQIAIVNKRGACQVADITDPDRESVSYARSIAKAWASVRYQAGINHTTERTVKQTTEPWL